MNSESSARFDAAAARLLAPDTVVSQADDLAIVHGWIQGVIRRRFSDVDAEDVAQETVARVLTLRGKGAEISSPAAYITTIAQRLALDAIRDDVAELSETDLDLGSAQTRISAITDDEIARFVDRSATDASVAAAMGLALTQKDYVVVRIVTKWLDLADEYGRRPSSREVAEKINTSHTTVNHALKRFRALLVRVNADDA